MRGRHAVMLLKGFAEGMNISEAYVRGNGGDGFVAAAEAMRGVTKALLHQVPMGRDVVDALERTNEVIFRECSCIRGHRAKYYT